MGRSSRRRALVTSSLVAGLLAATAPVVYAQDENEITDVAIVASTVDVHEGVASITYSVHCTIDVPLLRIRSVLTQRDASATVPRETSCSVGQTIQVTLEYGRQQGVFRPGPATIDGFVQVLLAGDVDDIPVDRVLLRPVQAAG